MGSRLQRALKHGRFAFWAVLALVNGCAWAACLHVGLFNWWSFAWFLISFAMATHYSSAK